MTDFIAAVQLHTKKDLKIWAERWLRQSGTDRISTEWASNGKHLRTIKVNLETPEGRQFRPQSLQRGLYALNAACTPYVGMPVEFIDMPSEEAEKLVDKDAINQDATDITDVIDPDSEIAIKMSECSSGSIESLGGCVI